MSTNRKVLVVTGASQGLGEGFVKASGERMESLGIRNIAI